LLFEIYCHEDILHFEITQHGKPIFVQYFKVSLPHTTQIFLEINGGEKRVVGKANNPQNLLTDRNLHGRLPTREKRNLNQFDIVELHAVFFYKFVIKKFQKFVIKKATKFFTTGKPQKVFLG
jgi:hypothetical protein